MLDIALIREKADWVRDQLRKLNDDAALARIDDILRLDAQRREVRTEAETLQATRNKLNKAMGKLRGDKKLSEAEKTAIALAAAQAIEAGDLPQAVGLMERTISPPAIGQANPQPFDALIALLKELGERVEANFERAKSLEAELNDNMLWVPNMPHDSVPVADHEDDNVPWTPEGTFREFDFTPKPHWDIGPELDIIDFERGVKLAGSRFYILKSWGARLQRALISFFLDQARDKGFQELYVPYMVSEDAMIGSTQFPKFRDVVYRDQEADLYMIPTAEVAITNMHAGEILHEKDLPLYYVAHTPCFRREKASAGRDVRGIKRVHQFEKVEMYKFVTPESSYDELESLTEAASDLCRALAIPFRRLEIVTGDLGFSAAKKYDLEMWAPGSEEWLEVSSCSNVEAFQARRAMVRYYPEGEKKAQYVHTLNGSGLGLTRVMIAIMENYQQKDGSVVIPEVLRPYLGGAERITRA